MTLPADCAAAYREVRLLGQGGCGRVYLCSQLKLDRLVAIKLLDSSVTKGSDIARRFDREARITAGLNHEHVIEVLDHGAETGVPWIAYEYAPDGSVRDLLERGALGPAEAVRVAEAVARALAAAHDKGIVHRDVKPENVLVTPGRVYKLTDFGVARWAGKGSISTAAGMVLGTPAYLAPEVVRGDEPGPESDLYALAVMLHELVSGRLPFDAPAVLDVLKLHLEAPPPPLAGATPELAALVARGLAKDPRERFASALDMANALARVPVDGPAPTVAPKRSGVTRVQSAAGARRPVTQVAPRVERSGVPRAAIAAGAVLLLAGAAVIGRQPAPRPSPSPSRAVPTPSATPEPSDLAPLYREAHDLSLKFFKLQMELWARPRDAIGMAVTPLQARQFEEAAKYSDQLALLSSRLRREGVTEPGIWLEIAVYARTAVNVLYLSGPNRAADRDKHVQVLLRSLRVEELPPAGRVACMSAELELAQRTAPAAEIFMRARGLLTWLQQFRIGTDVLLDCHLGKSWFYLTGALERLTLAPLAKADYDEVRKLAALAQLRVAIRTVLNWSAVPANMAPGDRLLEGLDGAVRALDLPLKPAERAEVLAGTRFLLVCAPKGSSENRAADLEKLMTKLRERAPQLPPMGTGVTPEALAAERAKLAPFLDGR